MSTYEGRVGLVTGASAGIGAAIAEALVKEGVIVVGAARRVEKIQALSDNLKGQPGRLIAKKLDVSKPDEIVELFKTIEKELGGIDVLINNAAVLNSKPIHEHITEELKISLEVNLMSVFLTAREAVNGWLRRKINDGYIVNINSIAGHKVVYFPGYSVGIYSATKHALTATCHQLRHDLKDVGLKCRVTSISPGAVDTDMTAEFKKSKYKDDFLSPEDVAKTVTFVLSTPKSVEITELTIEPTNEVF